MDYLTETDKAVLGGADHLSDGKAADGKPKYRPVGFHDKVAAVWAMAHQIAFDKGGQDLVSEHTEGSKGAEFVTLLQGNDPAVSLKDLLAFAEDRVAPKPEKKAVKKDEPKAVPENA